MIDLTEAKRLFKGKEPTAWELSESELAELFWQDADPSVEQLREILLADVPLKNRTSFQVQRLHPEYFVEGFTRRYFVLLYDGLVEISGYLFQTATRIDDNEEICYESDFCLGMCVDDGLSREVAVHQKGLVGKVIRLTFFSMGLSFCEKAVTPGELVLLPPIDLVVQAIGYDIGQVLDVPFGCDALHLDFSTLPSVAVVDVKIPKHGFKIVSRYWVTILSRKGNASVSRVRVSAGTSESLDVYVPFVDPQSLSLEITALQKGRYQKISYSGLVYPVRLEQGDSSDFLKFVSQPE